MGLFQDHFTSLSELERLAAMVQDPLRRKELGQQWPVAMMAYALLVSNDEERLDEVLAVYPDFREHTQVQERLKSLSLLENFIHMRKGEGWRAFLPYALADEALVSARAAQLTILMAKPEEGERFTGACKLIQLISSRTDVPKSVLGALLEMADLRLEPLLEPLLELPAARLSQLLPAAAANRLSCNWTLRLLEKRPDLAALVTDTLCAMAAAQGVLDVVVPIPVWAFTSPKIQPLHGWTLSEYFPRMLPQLEPYLSEEQLQRVRTAYQA